MNSPLKDHLPGAKLLAEFRSKSITPEQLDRYIGHLAGIVVSSGGYDPSGRVVAAAIALCEQLWDEQREMKARGLCRGCRAHAVHTREHKRRLTAAGICRQCGRVPRSDSCQLCETCRTKRRTADYEAIP